MAYDEATEPTSDLLTALDVAARWRVSPEKVRLMVRSGELAVLRFGERGMRFERAEIERYEEALRQEQVA